MIAESTKPALLTIEASQRKAYEKCLKGLTPVRATKCALYRDMKKYQRLCKDKSEEMQKIFEPLGGVDVWFHNTFGPICQLLCEDPYQLAKAIYDGMSLPCYLSKSPAIFIADKKLKDHRSNTKKVVQVRAHVRGEHDDDEMTAEESLEVAYAELASYKLREKRMLDEIKRLNELIKAYEKQIAILSGDRKTFLEAVA
jgi:hypothetical protein